MFTVDITLYFDGLFIYFCCRLLLILCSLIIIIIQTSVYKIALQSESQGAILNEYGYFIF